MAVLRYLLTPFLCTTDSTDDTAKSDWPSEDETSDEEYESDDDSSNAMNTTPATATRVRHETDSNTIPAMSHGHSTGIVPACHTDCNTSSPHQPAVSEEVDTMCTSLPPSYIYRTSHHHHHHTHRRRYVVYHTSPLQQPSSSSVTRSNKSNKMPFWSRLLCRPEVYDPCVEAAPTAEALRLQRPNVTTTTTTRVSGAAYGTTHSATHCAKDALPSCTQGVSECVASQHSDTTAAAVAEEDVNDSSKRSKADTMSMTLTAPIAVVVARQDIHSDAPGQPHDKTTQQHTSTNAESAVTASAACVSTTTITPSTSVTECAAAVRPASTLRGFRVQDTRFMQGTWCTSRHHACTTDTTHTVTCVATLHDASCRTDHTPPCHTTHDTQHAGCTIDSTVTTTNDNLFMTPPVSAALIVTPEQQQLSSDECEAATWRRHWAVLQAERTRVEQLRRVRLERRKTEYAAWRELCTATFPLAASEGCPYGEHESRQTATADDEYEGQQLSCTSETCHVVLQAECDEDALPLSYSTKTTTTDNEEEAAQSTSSQCNVAAALVRRRLARCCGNVHDVLGCSRRYIENTILTQRSQQVYALLALLSEARRHAWTLSCRLMQLYYYYIHPILQLTANETATHSSSLSWASHKSAQELAATLLTRSSSSAVRAIHQQYLYDTRVTLDYQLFRYVFDRTWNRLMHDVRSYLGPPCRPRTLSHHTTCEAVKQKCTGMTRKRVTRDEGHTPQSVAEDEACNEADMYSTTRPARCAANIDGDVMLPLSHETRCTHHTTHGSVRYAATLLYALELFERQHSLQCAVHEAERWITWYYAAMTTGSLHTILRDVNNKNNEEGCAVGSGAALSVDVDECDAAGTVTQLTVDTITSNNTCTTLLGDTIIQSATSEEMDSTVACYDKNEQAECCSMSCTLSTTSTTGLSLSPSLPQTPQLQSHTSHDDVPHIRLLSSCSTSTSSHEKTDDVTAAASCAHLPMQWHKAQDDALRETVSEERRWRRLCTVIAANRALQAQQGSM